MRIEMFKTEPVNKGNILVQVPDRTRTPTTSGKEMDQKIRQIMKPFDRNT